MQDGYGQIGVGQSDMRIASEDLQHSRQTRTADEAPGLHRTVHRDRLDGGPMKLHLDEELTRHRAAKDLRLQHLEQHYTR